MARREIVAGSTGQSVDVFLQDRSSGDGVISMTTSNVKAAYRIGTTGAVTTFALASRNTTAAWASGGWAEPSSTNMPGIYTLDVPDAACATTPSATVFIQCSTAGQNFIPIAMDLFIAPGLANGLRTIALSSGTGTGQIVLASGLVTATSLSNQSFPTNFSTLAISSSGEVNIKTNNDKTGYSLSQTFPSNFASLAISSSGEVNIKTNNDKTGYSLSQTFPTNFASLSITSSGEVKDRTAFPTNFGSLAISSSGEVNIKTNNDKTGYSLSQTFPTNFASLSITSSGEVKDRTAFPTNFGSLAISSSGEVNIKTNNDKTGYSLSQTFPSNFSSMLISSSGKVTLEQAFPSNFASLAISSSGEVNIKTNNDKTGYSLSQTFPSNFASLAITSSGEVTVGPLATAIKQAVADSFLDRDMGAGTDSGSSSFRTPRQALRFLRNKWAVSGTTLSVYKEDDATASWTAVVTTDATASPITANDPA